MSRITIGHESPAHLAAEEDPFREINRIIPVYTTALVHWLLKGAAAERLDARSDTAEYSQSGTYMNTRFSRPHLYGSVRT